MGWLQVPILVPNVGHPPLLCVFRVTSARRSARQLDECLHPAGLRLVSDWILQQQKAAEAEETAEGEDNRREVNRQIRRVPPGGGALFLGSVLHLFSVFLLLQGFFIVVLTSVALVRSVLNRNGFHFGACWKRDQRSDANSRGRSACAGPTAAAGSGRDFGLSLK